MRFTAIVLIAVALTGCAHVKRTVTRPDANPPTLRQRPNFTGPHYEVQVFCVKKVEWYQGWCESTEIVGQFICHDVVITVPPACVTVNAGAQK